LYIFYILPYYNLTLTFEKYDKKPTAFNVFQTNEPQSSTVQRKKTVSIQGGSKNHFIPHHRLSYTNGI